MARKSRSGRGRNEQANPEDRERSLGKRSELDRARFKQLLALNPRLCGAKGNRWSTGAIAAYLRRHGYSGIITPRIRASLLLSGCQHSKETNEWQLGPPLPIPPSPRAFEHHLKELQLPVAVNPQLLVPSHKRFRFLKALSRAGHWIQRPPLVARVVGKMDKNTANSLLRSLVSDAYAEVRTETSRRRSRGRVRNEWRILPHGRRTVAHIEPHADELYRCALPDTEDAKILYLLQAFPQGLFGQQVVQALRKRRSRQRAAEVLQHVLDNGYVERTTVADNVDFGLDRHERRFYRLSPEGHRWAELLQALAASRYPERVKQNTSRRRKAPVDDGDIPVKHPFTEDMTEEELTAAEAAAAQARSRARLPRSNPILFEELGDGCLVYRGPTLSEEAALAMGFGLAIQRRRVRARISREQFAERAGLRPQYLPLLEIGERLPPPGKWPKFAQILGTSALGLLKLACQIIEDELPVLASATSTAILAANRRGGRRQSRGLSTLRAGFSKHRSRPLPRLEGARRKRAA